MTEYVEYTYQCCRCGEVCYEELKEQEVKNIEPEKAQFICISCWDELTGGTDEFHWQFVAQ